MKSYTLFPPDELSAVAKTHEECLKSLVYIEDHLNSRLANMSDAIQAMILSVASREPLLFIGPPGTAKSWLVRAFCEYIGIDLTLKESERENGASQTTTGADSFPIVDYFEYLLTPFTEPSELFGYFDIITQKDASGVDQQVLKRNETNMMQHAKVVFLDEVFKGSSAILNSLLAFMNERVFHDRGRRKEVALECLFGATNDPPTSSELLAIFDRFTLRCWVENVQGEQTDLHKLLSIGWTETYKPKNGVAKPVRAGEQPGATGKYSPKGKQAQTPQPALAAVNQIAGHNTYPQLLDQLSTFRTDIARRFTLRQSVESFLDKDPKFLRDLSVTVKNVRRNDLSLLSNRRLVKFLYVMLIYSLYRAVKANKHHDPIVFEEDDILRLLRTFFLDRRNEYAEQRLTELM